MIAWTLTVALPVTVGVALLALCGLGLAWNIGWITPAQVPLGPLMKILDRMTDRPLLEKLLADTPTGRPTDIDRAAVDEKLKERIFGQDAVIEDVLNQVYARFARSRRSQPVGVFMIAGPSGIGKTEFGKALGEALYGEHGAYLVDMSSMNDPSGATTLFGVPPGFVGHGSAISFVAHLMANPKTVIVLDEFEKAHRDIQRRFLSAWQDGYIHELSGGRRVSTTDAIFILTVNAMEDQVAQLAQVPIANREELSDRCKEVLRPVFETAILSRIDYVFPYVPLEKTPFAALVLRMIEQLVQDYELECKPVSPHVLVDYVKKYHSDRIDARSIKRQVERDFSERILALKAAGAKKVSISYKKNTIAVEAG